MAGKKDNNDNNKKDSQLVIRVSATEREAFLAACDALDTTASREIRQFMKKFLADFEAARDKN
ncbi:MAG: hypothetical protein AAGC77_03150 [Pseudomonadota bacterium]